MRTRRATVTYSLLLVGLAAGVGFWAGNAMERGTAQDGKNGDGKNAKTEEPYSARTGDPNYLRQSPGVQPLKPDKNDYGLGPCYVSELKPFPQVKAGQRTPFDLWRYAGLCGPSQKLAVLDMPWADWVKMCKEQKPKLMADVRSYMKSRFDFHGKTIPGTRMTRGKPIMAGPIARLPKGFKSWEELGKLSPEELRKKDIFPYMPLAHPLQTTAHMVFPDNWVQAHPEHERMDVGHDFPNDYLPEFPPPMFLTNHKELGDVTGGREVTFANYYEIFNGLLTPEQLEGLKELLVPTPTTWFNHIHHRVTEQPSAGVACFSCHVNGHTNGAFELAPDARPNLARLRVDTPSMRGNYNVKLFGSRRSIRSMDHFSEVEEYFDGDHSIALLIGLRAKSRGITNRMGDFNAMLDFPPAPKLGRLGKLIKSKATESELRGEALFFGKAKCAQCHSGPAFCDDMMHDLKVEDFYIGRPEGPIKTFPLRGIKDSPPYLHDGRCPTLHDAVEFFNLILELRLTREEKEDLVAYLLCL